MTDTQASLSDLVEDPDRVEAAYLAEQEAAKTDPKRRALLEAIYAESDRDTAFERFRQSQEWSTIQHLLHTIPVAPSASIVEIGGGAGFLSWALSRAGSNVHLVEPNGHWTTGTGYLRTRQDHDVTIWNDLGEWYGSDELYDCVVTRNCVHHFPPLPYVAACVHERVRPGGVWVMLREAFSDSHKETVSRVASHPYSQAYGLYEFFFDPEYYVRSMREGGFKLEAVVPGRYANSVLETYAEEKEPTLEGRLLTGMTDVMLKRARALTRAAYTAERIVGKVIGRPPRRFSRPPALIFRRS